MTTLAAISPIPAANSSHWVGRAWHRSGGAVSLLLCIVFLIAYLSWYHPLGLSLGIKSVLALYFLNVIPGYLLLRALLRLRTPTRFEMFVASLLTGMLVAPMLWYLLAWLHVGWLFIPLFCLLGVIVPLKQRWHRRLGARVCVLVRRRDAWILWLTLGIVVLWSYQLRIVDIQSDGVAVLPYRDHCLHATFVAELLRSIPMESMPCLAGARKWAYHHMPDVWAAMMARFTGASANEAYMYLALVMRYVFVALGIYLALVRRFGRAGAMAGMFFALGVSGVPGVRLLTYHFSGYFHTSYPTAFGLVGVCLTLYAVSIPNRDRYRPGLLLAAVMSVLLLWHKANYALVVAPAVAVFITGFLLRRRDYTWLLVCAAAQGALTAVRYVDLSTADVHLTFMFNGVNYMYCWWKTLDVPQALAAWKTPIEQLPVLARWPIIYAACATFTFHFGLISVVFLLVRWRRRAGAYVARRADVLTLLILAAAGLGFILLPVQKDADYNVSAHIGIMVQALLLSLLGPASLWALSCVPASARRVALPVMLLLAAFLVADTAHKRRINHLPRPSVVLSQSTYAAYQFLRANSPEDAVILVPTHEAQSVAGLLTQRRIVLERSDTWRLFYDTTPILADVDGFYEQPLTELSVQTLRRYQVDYMIAVDADARFRDSDGLLEEVFRQGDVVVYRVNRRVALNRAPTVRERVTLNRAPTVRERVLHPFARGRPIPERDSPSGVSPTEFLHTSSSRNREGSE